MTVGDETSRRLHPRLRCLGNGAAPVNALRSDISSTVATSSSFNAEMIGLPANFDLGEVRECMMKPVTDLSDKMQRLPKRKKMENEPPAQASFVNVFVELYSDAAGLDSPDVDRIALLSDSGGIRTSCAELSIAGSSLLVRRNIVSATVPISALQDLVADPAVAFVHPADPLRFDQPLVSPKLTLEPAARSVGPQALRKLHQDGADVIIGIIDVGGFDFAHPDFLDDTGKTRFLSIWDQGGDFRAPPSKRFNYGSELTQPLMNAAIAGQKAGKFPATWCERQSQRIEASHATHVASIAAGNKGVCPSAQLAAVLISVPNEPDSKLERRSTFSDSTRVVHAVEYLLEIAAREKKPISINISLGTNGGAHDGSSGVCRWIDALLTTPGRSVCVAAGNAGQEKSETRDDLGYILGRIHSKGRIASRGLSTDIEWTVIGNGIEDMSENELEIWYSAQDRITVMLKPPSFGSDWITVRPCEFVENRRLGSGTTVSVYNELYHPTNGCNYTAVYLSPNYQPGNLRGVEAGIWKVRLVGDEIRDGRFNCWIERDDPIELEPKAGRRFHRFPSFFSEASNVDSHSISSLACAQRVISVANLDDAGQRISKSSSQGPTRDDRTKPDVAAPGTNIVAAKGFSEDTKAWIGMSGTSMASPYVCGVVGLMLAVNRSLTAAQCLGVLQRTARPLPGASYEWRNDAGFGVIDPAAAVDEARTFNRRTELR